MSAEATKPGKARILVAEDEFLVYLALEDELGAKGYEVIGPFGTLRAAREALDDEKVDLVLLDINIGGSMAWPIADELIARDTPFIFLSGYAADALPERYRDMPRVGKPYDPAMLQSEIRRLLNR